MLRVSEIYKSYQGEGPNTGIPTVFVRFAGCNLKCPGWACDTQHAIDPKLFMKDSTVYEDPETLANDIRSYLVPGDNVCLTGGEVMLQNAQDLEYALEHLTAHTGVEVELFTNGTFRMDRGFRSRFSNIILDWKLPGAKEKQRPEWEQNTLANLKLLHSGDAVKFTVADDADIDEAEYRWTNILNKLRNRPEVYCGVVWGKMAEAELASKLISRELPWRLNVQVHKFIWNSDARRV